MNKNLFQSGEKHPRWGGGPLEFSCVICGDKFFRRRSIAKDKKRGKYCGRKCYDESQRRKTMEKSLKWRGGKSHDVHGYVIVKFPTHPYAKSNGYVMEHRLVMEKSLGRFLSPSEVVHHVNFDKKDNRIENLKLFSSASEHNKFHSDMKFL